MGERIRLWKNWRLHLRLCRITLLLFILTLVSFVLWLDIVGLPEFAKRPLIDALHQRGIELQFVRLRWNPAHGIEADNVRIGGKTPESPSLTLQELRLQLDYRALLHRQFQLRGVVLRQGEFILPLGPTNKPPDTLTFDHIQTELRFQTNDVWSLDDFQARFIGAKFILSGELTHASAATNWHIFQHQNVTPAPSQAQLEKIAETLNQIHFDRGSQLSLSVNGDARNIQSLYAALTVNAPGGQTPWGSARDIKVVAHSVASREPFTAPSTLPLEIDWKSQVADLRTPWGSARDIQIVAHVVSANQKLSASPGLPWAIDWQSQLADLDTEKLRASFVSCGGSWRAPEAVITNLYARLGGGELRAGIRYNVNSGMLSFTNASCFDVSAIYPLLTEKTRERFSQFSFGRPPQFTGSGSFTLPDWKNAGQEWRDRVQPTIQLKGELALTNINVSAISLDRVSARFSYSNETWTVPAAIVTRPEGSLEIAGTENDNTTAYQWSIRGPISVGIIQPFLPTGKVLQAVQRFQFPEPVYLDARIRGRLYDYDSIVASGHASVRNLIAAGEPIDSVETDFHYARRVADFLNPRLRAGRQSMQADGVCLDYPGDRICFTNGLGTADPQRVANVIGPIPAQVMQPYHFLQLPTARVNGYAPLRDSTNADLDFQIVGTAALEVLKIQSPAISGEIHWKGQTLLLTNLAGSIYGGTGSGSALFDFTPPHSANFSFVADFQNVNLHLLAMDLGSPTNHLEGLVGGHFVVSSGNSADWRSCYGYGYANLRDGLLWDEPVFGILSPILNTVSPGLGNSRATDASARFVMNRGVISTEDLQIHTAMMRLLYTGSVNLQGRLDAHVTAELLRDVPAVGQFLSTVFWPVGKVFECKVTGTWSQPQSKLVYLPTKLLLNVLHPIHALEDWFPNQSEFNNAPKQP